MKIYRHFIPENVSPRNTKKIGIYNAKGERLFGVMPGNLALKKTGEKIYSFGALSDVHIGVSTALSDFKSALSYLSDMTDFICISGDLIHGSPTDLTLEEQIAKYIECIENYATKPVYACAGNHDGYYVDNIETVIESYTGHPLYYSFTQGSDVFIFVGNRSDTTGSLFTVEELQWLYEVLEENRNKRCFVFQHVRPDDACGNALGIYTHDIWGGTEQIVFESLLQHYSNVVFFHGHSHLKYDLQQHSEVANIDKKFGCWSVHIPSITVPRGTDSVVNPSRVELYAESEGYIIDVYENGIHLRGRDFIKGEFLPIASYWLDTTLQPVEANTYVDSTGTIKT